MYGSVLPTSVEHTAQDTGHSEEEEVRAQSVASYRTQATAHEDENKIGAATTPSVPSVQPNGPHDPSAHGLSDLGWASAILRFPCSLQSGRQVPRTSPSEEGETATKALTSHLDLAVRKLASSVDYGDSGQDGNPVR